MNTEKRTREHLIQALEANPEAYPPLEWHNLRADFENLEKLDDLDLEPSQVERTREKVGEALACLPAHEMGEPIWLTHARDLLEEIEL